MTESTTDWWPWIGQIAGVASGVAGVVGLWLHFTQSSDAVERWVSEDPEYREMLAAELRGERLGGLYQHTLASGLHWLDRRFGPAASSHALGICIVISLYYSYVMFMLSWGTGGPGNVADVEILNDISNWLDRLLASLTLVALPPLSLLLGRSLSYCDRHLRARAVLRSDLFNLLYRSMWPSVLVGVLIYLDLFEAKETLLVAFFAVWCALGPLAGRLAAVGRSNELLRGPAAFAAGAAAALAALPLAVPIAGAIGGPGDIGRALAFLGAITAPIVGGDTGIGGAIAGLIAMVGTIAVTRYAAGPLNSSITLPLAVPTVAAVGSAIIGAIVVGKVNGISDATGLAIVFAIAMFGATGACYSEQTKGGAVSGSIGTLSVVGLVASITGAAKSEFAILLVMFFIVLPLSNGLWDWLSWWVSRSLGHHLLADLQGPRPTAWRAFVILWHANLDLIAAFSLFLSLAFVISFGFEAVHSSITLRSSALNHLSMLEHFIQRAAASPWTDGLWLTVMLISTLVPTALHLIMLLASPIVLVAMPTEKRIALASDLERYSQQPERQPSIRRRAGQYVARERHGALALGTFVFVLLVALIGIAFKLIYEGGFATLVLWIAQAGIWTGGWLAGLF